jgi:hypothetical protein
MKKNMKRKLVLPILTASVFCIPLAVMAQGQHSFNVRQLTLLNGVQPGFWTINTSTIPANPIAPPRSESGCVPDRESLQAYFNDSMQQFQQSSICAITINQNSPQIAKLTAECDGAPNVGLAPFSYPITITKSLDSNVVIIEAVTEGFSGSPQRVTWRQVVRRQGTCQ